MDIPEMQIPAIPPVTDRWPYIDLVQLWVFRPLEEGQQATLAANSRTVHVKNKPMRYRPKWRQRLQLRQPSDEALRYLDDVTGGDHMINQVEVALDFIAPDDEGAERLKEFFDTHLIQRWRGKRCQWSVGQTSYWSRQRWVRNQPVLYSGRHSKVTGQADCLHIEWRISIAGAVRDAGIHGLHDLVGFDHRRFWEKRMQLRAIDYKKLGRASRDTRRRKPWIREFVPGYPFDVDERIGHLIARAVQREGPDGQPLRPLGCAQEIKDRCGFDISQALVKIPAEKFYAI